MSYIFTVVIFVIVFVIVNSISIFVIAVVVLLIKLSALVVLFIVVFLTAIFVVVIILVDLVRLLFIRSGFCHRVLCKVFVIVSEEGNCSSKVSSHFSSTYIFVLLLHSLRKVCRVLSLHRFLHICRG